MTQPLRVGIVGMGKMGRIRATHAHAAPGVEVAYVTDIDPSRIGDSGGATILSDYQALLERQPDAVFVCTYNDAAPRIVASALERGIHVFCEKPPARTVEELKQVIRVHEQNPQCVLKYGFNHRKHYSVMEAKAMVESGRFGKILWIRGVYGKCGTTTFANEWRNDPQLSGGGILIDQGIHMLDLFLWFLGPFSSVQSLVHTAHWDIPVEDNAFAILQNNAGQVALLHSSATQWKHRFSFEICLEDGYINASGILSSTRSYGDETLTYAKKQLENESRAFGKPREETIFFDRDDSWALELDEFLAAIRGQAPVEQGTADDALKVLELVETIRSNSG